MDVSQALRARRSVRAFTPQVPSAALVQQLMEDAALAASGGNLQPWRVAALTGGPLQALLVEVAATPAQESDALLSYPPDLWEPYRTRRFVNGEDMVVKLTGINGDNLSWNSDYATVALI